VLLAVCISLLLAVLYRARIRLTAVCLCAIGSVISLLLAVFMQGLLLAVCISLLLILAVLFFAIGSVISRAH
jgi:hypothetical protein